MLQRNYDGVYIITDGNHPVIKTGKFTYNSSVNHYLTEVNIKTTVGHHTMVTGYKRYFSYHDNYYSRYNIRKDHKNLYIKDSDWYFSKLNRVHKFFNIKAIKLLKEGWYMRKDKKKEMTFVFHGSFVEEHTYEEKDKP